MKKTLAFLLVLANLLSFSSFAESVVRHEHNAYFHCQHTRQKIERTKHCPCGCNKKSKKQLRIVSESSDCESDDVVAHLPAFSQLNLSVAGAATYHPTFITSYFSGHDHILLSFYLTPLVSPG